jgi:hypothetical protein
MGCKCHTFDLKIRKEISQTINDNIFLLSYLLFLFCELRLELKLATKLSKVVFVLQMNKAAKDLDLFMRKDPPVLTMDEMRGSAALIDK